MDNLYNNFVSLFTRIDEVSLGDNITMKCSFDKSFLETKKNSYLLGESSSRDLKESFRPWPYLYALWK